MNFLCTSSSSFNLWNVKIFSKFYLSASCGCGDINSMMTECIRSGIHASPLKQQILF